MADSFITSLTNGWIEYCYIYPCGRIRYLRDFAKDPNIYLYEEEDEGLVMLEDRRQFLYPGGFFLFKEQLYKCITDLASDAWILEPMDMIIFDLCKQETRACLMKLALLPDITDIIVEYSSLTKTAELFPKYVTDTFKNTAGLTMVEKQVLEACLVPQRLFEHYSCIFAGPHYLNSLPSQTKRLITDGFLVKF